MSKLKNFRIRDAKWLVDSASGTDVLHVTDPHALVQAAGYLKFLSATNDSHTVFFRGQGRYRSHLSPSLFRGLSNVGPQSDRVGALNKLMAAAKCKSKTLADLPSEALEPLLQHYGIRTSWIDLVDNLWVALWFACHRFHSTGDAGEYAHYERRVPRRESDDDRFAYVVLVAAETAHDERNSTGFWHGNKTELIDLRLKVPSFFVRPHAQHGVLFRLKGTGDKRPLDYRTAIVGTIRVDLEDALEWLGDGRLLDVRGLFPPAFYDTGYRILLDDFRAAGLLNDPVTGTIWHIGT